FLDVGKLLSSSGPGSVNDHFLQSIKVRHTAVSGSNIDMDKAMEMAQKNIDAFSQKRVLLLPSEFQEVVYKTTCMSRPLVALLMKGFTEGWTAFPYYSHDPEAEPILMSLIVTQSL